MNNLPSSRLYFSSRNSEAPQAGPKWTNPGQYRLAPVKDHWYPGKLLSPVLAEDATDPNAHWVRELSTVSWLQL